MSGILQIEYEYFQLEGIPPYPSPYVTIDARDVFWVDLSDPNRTRFERRYRTREATPREGLERYYISEGAGGRRKECTFYDGKEECTLAPISRTLSFDNWLTDFNFTSNKLLAKTTNPAAVGGYEYKGIQGDPQWGQVHIFQRSGMAQASDLYKDKPTIEAMRIDVAQSRMVELSKTVIDGDKQVVHSLYRLVTWKVAEPSQVPADLFTLSPN